MFERVLVPTDFSLSSEAALKTVRRHFSGALVRLLHVISAQQVAAFSTATPTSPVDAASARQKLVDEALVRLKELAREGEETVAVVGGPVDAILSHAADWHPDLIVMGTHGRTGLAHFLNGSVAEGVVRHARLPVLIVHEAHTL